MSTDHWLFGIAVLVTVGFALLIRAGLDDVLTLSTALFKRTRRIRLTRSLTVAADATLITPFIPAAFADRDRLWCGSAAGYRVVI